MSLSEVGSADALTEDILRTRMVSPKELVQKKELWKG